MRPLLADFGDEIAVNTFLQGVKSPEAVRRAIEGLPGVHFFDQLQFLNDVYAEFRSTTVRQIFTGNFLVIGLLLLRYRRLRPALAAFFPSVLVSLILLGSFAGLGVETSLLHVVGLVMVLGMGVDYGVFVVDSASHPEEMGVTMLSTFLGSITTVFTFGVLALSQHPALRALGITIGVGILLSFLLAPLALLLLRDRSACRARLGRRAPPGCAWRALLPALGCAWLGLGLARVLPDAARECPGRLLPTQQIEGEFRSRQRVRVQGEDLDWRLELVAEKRADVLVLVGLDAFGGKLFAVTQRGTEISVERPRGRLPLPADRSAPRFPAGRSPRRMRRPSPA